MVVEVQQAEKRATRRFALRLPVSVNYSGNTGPVLSAQTRDVSARGICFFLQFIGQLALQLRQLFG